MKFSARLLPSEKLSAKGPELIQACDLVLNGIGEGHGAFSPSEIALLKSESHEVFAKASTYLASCAEAAFLANRDEFLRDFAVADPRMEDANEDVADSFKRFAQARALLALLLSGSCVLTFGEGSTRRQ